MKIPFRRPWSFKVYILTLFLMLTVISFSCIGIISFSKQYSSDLSFSKGIAKRAAATINEKLDAMAHSSIQTTQVISQYALVFQDLSIENQKLTSLLLNVVKYNTNLANVFMGLDNGNFLGAYNRNFSDSMSFHSDPSKLLPTETAFSLTYIDITLVPPKETRVYMNEHFIELARETFEISEFNVKHRPWYAGAVKTRDVFWTDIYPFIFMHENGISVAFPSIDPDGKIAAVVGTDQPFVFFTNFIDQQKIGKTGRAFLIDSQGKILAPLKLPGDTTHQETLSVLISDAYERYQTKNQDEERFIVTHDHEKYLTYVTKLPPAFNEDWRVVIIAPLKDFLGKTILSQKQLLLITICILIVTSFIIVKYTGRISTPMAILSKEVDKISRLDLKSNLHIRSNITEILLIRNAVEALRRAVHSFAKYIPKEIVLDLFQKKEEILLGGEKRELTIFFSDISGFSDIAESLSIDLLSQLLSEYFDHMSKIILKESGTIDKYLGDGIMAFWGAPLPISNHAAKACTAALLCKTMVTNLNQKRKKEGLPEFITRFGINTGVAIVGNIGTQEMMNYTAIGDAVNITSRLQIVDKTYHTSILISEHVCNYLDNRFIIRPLDVILVKGKVQKIKIYELVGKKGSDKEIEPTEQEILLCKLFREAYEAEEANDLKKAYELFSAIAQQFPEDYPTQLHLERLKNLS
ncbi:MAG: hypothetical protein JSR93_06625 [Verrucomicrobia bacterium]|nr:hypothetical protein [Verrucomicrobiota bacterium]